MSQHGRVASSQVFQIFVKYRSHRITGIADHFADIIMCVLHALYIRLPILRCLK